MINIIAEIGCNHMGDAEIAKKLIEKAFLCGTDYVKFQKRCPSEFLTTEQYVMPYHGPNSFGKTYGEHREELEIEIGQWKEIIEIIDIDNYEKLNFDISEHVFATAFDMSSLLDITEYLKPSIIKIGSGQVGYNELIQAAANTGCKIIMSTGMSTIDEIDNAYEIIKDNEPVLMQCTSVYPCQEKDVNLNVIPELKKRYGCEVGLSGHYVSGSGAIEAAAVALGATWIERHFTLDRTWKGTDQAASLEPTGLKNVVKAVRSAQLSLGCGTKGILPVEYPARKKHRRY